MEEKIEFVDDENVVPFAPKKRGRPPLDPAQKLMTLQKNIRLPVDVFTKLETIKATSRAFSNNYIIVCILQAVIDRIVENAESSRQISLDGLKVHL
jgi:hypothetical protein